MNCLVQGVYGAIGIWRIKKKKKKGIVSNTDLSSV
jgi:hypothetical protein